MPRARLVITAALVTVGTLLLAAPSATPATSADAVRTGFRIPADGTAGGSWIGSRTVGGQVVYRIDPGKTTPSTAGFGTPVWRSPLTGSGPHQVTARDTARAAWILAKYGTYDYDIQNAAVEVAVDHLLYGGSWSLNGSRTSSRLSTVAERSKIRSFATTMLADSVTFAGPYSIVLTAGDAVVGGTVPVTVSVVATSTGTGVPQLPVTVRAPGAVRELRTDSTGRATATFLATGAGTATVDAVVSKVPETRLLVRAPSANGASRVAVAGMKTTLSAAVTVRVRSTATPTPTPSPTASPTSSPTPSPTASPTSSATPNPSATPSPTPTPTATPTPTPSPTATAAPLPTPTLRVSTGANQILAGTRTRPQVVISGLPVGYWQTATLRLYGPAAQQSGITCQSSTLFHTQTLLVTDNGTYTGVDVRLDGPGYYGWSVELPGSTASAPAWSGCAPAGAVVQVVQW